jgi:outer membrane protein assembly factor BamB
MKVVSSVILIVFFQLSDCALSADARFPQGRILDCRSGDKSIVLWRTDISGQTGPLRLAEKILVFGSSSNPFRTAEQKNDSAAIVCVDVETGKFLWRRNHPRLANRIQDIPGSPIRSRPFVVHEAVYYMSNRGELVSLDAKGFLDDQNDGPFTAETGTARFDADIRWDFDLIAKLGVFKRDAGDVGNPLPSPVVVGGKVYSTTGNGSTFGIAVNREESFVPAPNAPAFVCLDATDGRLIWANSAPGTNTFYGQWSSPIALYFEGQTQVVFPGADGQLYGFSTESGTPLWIFNCNPPTATKWSRAKAGTANPFFATPVASDDTIYVGLNRDFEMPATHAPLLAIKVPQNREGSPRPELRWQFTDPDFQSTFVPVAVGRNMIYAVGNTGVLFALHKDDGRELWRASLRSENFPSQPTPLVHNNRVYIGSGQSLFAFDDSPQRTCLGRYDFNGYVFNSPEVSHGIIYLVAGTQLYALKEIL